MPTLKLISATDTQYPTTVLKSMNDQRNHGLFCDATIVVQDKKFRAHRTILSASSSYFHQQFSISGQVIELNFVRAEIFEHILNYIYSSKIVRVRSDMLEELISAGKSLGVQFIANLATPLSQVKGLPGLSKDTENKSELSPEMMPIITECCSISAEEFNQSSNSAVHGEDSDNEVMFVSQSGPLGSNQKTISAEVIDVDAADSGKDPGDQISKANHAVPKYKDQASTTPKIKEEKGESLPQTSADSVSNGMALPAAVSSNISPTTSLAVAPEPEHSVVSQPSEKGNIMGVHKKQITTSSEKGDKIKLSDVSGKSSPPKLGLTAKKTVTLNTSTEIDSISSGCKVYANIGENTYDIVPEKEDPGEGGSKTATGKRVHHINPPDKTVSSPNKKKNKTELDDHYELVMDGKTFYVCTVCKRPYVCLPSLRRHFNIHSWERQYPCRHCDKVFALAEYRTKHEILHTGERRYQCLLCNAMFLNYQLLSNHCRQAHNQDPSGRKQKDDKDNNLYRLLPCKTVPMKAYSWESNGSSVPVIYEDGSIHHLTPTEENFPSSSNQRSMMNWDDVFVQPDAHMARPEGHAPTAAPMAKPPHAENNFDFVIPDTY